VLVKLRAPLAQAVESALPLQSMALSQGVAKSAPINTFLGRYTARTLKPLYPNLVRIKKQQGLSDLQIATGIQQKFAKRGSRLRGIFQPPEISRTYLLELDSTLGKDPQQILKELNADPEVEFAEPEHIYTTNQLPNDPYLSSTGTWGQTYQDLWGLYKINATSAWNTALGDGVIVAVVDTGIDYNHPDIAANIWINKGEIPNNGIDDDHNGYIDDVRGWDFTTNTNDPIDHFGHGTHVAGTIAAVGNNGIGVIGIAWHAQVMAVKGLNDFGSGDDTTLAPAITYAANNGADVINASWGGSGSSKTIEDAIKFAYNLGVVFVAAAGNSSQDALNFFPANSPEAITVSASDSADQLAYFSNFGSKIDVAAPGVDVLSLQAAGTKLGPVVSPGYCRLQGTSMAAPHVSGVAALILSQNSAYSGEQVRQVIRASATDIGPTGYDLSFGYGRVNAAGALTITSPLEAKISGLQFGAGPLSPITISGIARGTGFVSYALDYGAGSLPATWTNLLTSSNPASGTLGVLDPNILTSEGTFAIRLTATSASGGTFVDRTQFSVTFAAITSPVPSAFRASATTFKAGMTIPIVGMALNPGFQNFQVQWASGATPTSGWQNTGITLTGGGLTPITSGQLATWDTSSITQAGYFTIRLTVTGANFSDQLSTVVYLEPDLLSANWPIFLDQGPYVNSGVVPALNADGTLRLVAVSPYFGAPSGAFWSLSLDGSSQKMPLPISGSFHQPSVADLDGAGSEEAVVADGNVIQVFHQDMSSSTFTPSIPSSGYIDFRKAPIVLEDLAGDSQRETIAAASDFYYPNAYLFAWRPNGQLLNNNFPIKLQDQNSLNGWLNHTRLLVGDFDGGGHKEMVVQEGLTYTTYTLRLFANDGTPRPWNVPVLTGVPFAMAAADLDHNGKLETILVSYNGNQVTLHVFQPDGSERAGWPVTLLTNDQYAQSFLAVGDMNHDGQEEIVFSHEEAIYLYNSDGTLFSNAWPLLTNTFGPGTGYGAVVIGDVDGDGLPEIVTTHEDSFGNSDAKLLVIRRDGTVARSWQLTGKNGFAPYSYPLPAVGDFNHDGITDIAVTYQVIAPGQALHAGVVTILSTGAPFNPSRNDWPLLLHDARNTGVLSRPLPSATNTVVALSSGTNPSIYGQPLTFTATVTPQSVTGAPTGKVTFYDGNTLLGTGILNSGQAALTTSAPLTGSNSITAVYGGDADFAVSNSPALSQTVNQASSSTVVTLTSGTNPSTYGQQLSFTVTVNPQFSGTPTGSVTLYDGNTLLGLATLDGGQNIVFTMFSAGAHSIKAVYGGDANFTGSTSPVLSQTVNPAPLAVTANNKTRLYGTPNPPLDGVVTGLRNGDTVTATYSTTATTLSALGSYPIVPAVSGSVLTNYTVTLNNGVLRVSDRLILIQVVTGRPRFKHPALKVMVTGLTATPTGIVTVSEGTTVLGSGTLDNGNSVIDASQLTLGKHTITVDYSGDGNYGAMTSDAFNFYRSPKPH